MKWFENKQGKVVDIIMTTIASNMIILKTYWRLQVGIVLFEADSQVFKKTKQKKPTPTFCLGGDLRLLPRGIWPALFQTLFTIFHMYVYKKNNSKH